MRWAVATAVIGAALTVAGCSQTRETALVPAAGHGTIAVPVIEPGLFPDTVLQDHYRRRLAEQPPLPLGNRDTFTYYQRRVTRY